jgi:hypothetical protein
MTEIWRRTPLVASSHDSWTNNHDHNDGTQKSDFSPKLNFKTILEPTGNKSKDLYKKIKKIVKFYFKDMLY